MSLRGRLFYENTPYSKNGEFAYFKTLNISLDRKEISEKSKQHFSSHKRLFVDV